MILADRKERLQYVLKSPVIMIPYSAHRGHNLQELFTILIEHCKTERSWLFGALKAFSPDDFIPAAYRDQVRQATERRL